MNQKRKSSQQLFRIVFVAALCVWCRCAFAQDETPLSFAVSYDPSVCESYTGRVYVMLSANTSSQPRFGPNWFNTEPFYAVDVYDMKPGEFARFDGSKDTFAFPAALSQLPAGEYAVQAVLRRNPDSPNIGRGEGTAYSEKKVIKLDAKTSGPISLFIDKVVEASDRHRPRTQQLIDNGRLVLVHERSEVLSKFHGRDIYQDAAILLPDGYDDEANAQRKYPALYLIGGFGGDEFQAIGMGQRGVGRADDVVLIGLDPLMRTGHHVFADSANNGPVGEAFVKELIPFLENRFRLEPSPHGRFVTGVSSGGWSSLWLQVTYPDTFGGVWSFSPDPVDFHKFQTVDIYAPGANMYHDENGDPRPLGRNGDQVIIWSESFAKMEVVMGEGGQLHSFEAVFSPKGEDGKPMPLYDRETGAIDPKVAEAWKQYDIHLVLKDNWQTLGPKLQGKLHIITGEDDNFYLEDAVKLLKESLEKLGSDARVEIVPGANHGTAMSGDELKRMHEELIECFENGK